MSKIRILPEQLANLQARSQHNQFRNNDRNRYCGLLVGFEERWAELKKR